MSAGKLDSVAAPGEVQGFPQGAETRLMDITVTVAPMYVAEALGDQDLDGLTEKLVAPVPEEPLRLSVYKNDPLLREDHDPIGRGFYEVAEERLLKGGVGRGVARHGDVE